MNAHASNVKIRLLRRSRIQFFCFRNRHSELVLVQPRRYIGMGLRRYVWVHPDCDRGPLLHPLCRGCQCPQFRGALDIEQKNPGLERKLDLRHGLAHAREHNAARRRSLHPQHTLQFAAGNNIKSCARALHQLQDGQRRVRFHRVAKRVGNGSKSADKGLQPRADHFRRVNIEGSAVARRELFEGNRLAEKFLVTAAGRSPVRKRRRPQLLSLGVTLHLRLPGPPFTLMATTV